MNISTTTADRVPANTEDHINRRIHRAIEQSILYHSHHPEQIDERLDELDREWNIERILETNASALALTGICLGVVLGKRWLLLPAAVSGFLLQHGVQGWCPPVPLLRRLGARTPQEIEAERYALKMIRGDFKDIDSGPGGAEAAARATGRLNGRHGENSEGSNRAARAQKNE